jgi:tripartite-type tricarboxylate transporter receptor subunit TctC
VIREFVFSHHPLSFGFPALFADRHPFRVKCLQEKMEELMSVELSRRAFIATGVATGAVAPLGAQTANWPSRPVTMVVPYGPGASNDLFTRALSEILSRKFNQPFVVENRAGAGGFTGTSGVVRAAPDGYTFLEMPNSIAGFKPGMKVDFDPLTNLSSIALLCHSPTALVVNASLPINTVAEYIAHVKANPTASYYGFAGIGTAQHQHMEMFAKLAGIAPKGVNYKSSADAQTDLVAGRTQAMIVTVASTLGQIQSGQLRLIAYTNDSYPSTSPKAPTMAEAGVKGMEGARSFWAVYGPPGLPAGIVTAMNKAINEALSDASFAALMAKSGAIPLPGGPELLTKILKEEVELVDAFFKEMKL